MVISQNGEETSEETLPQYFHKIVNLLQLQVTLQFLFILLGRYTIVSVGMDTLTY